MELAHPTQPSRLYQARVLVPELERRQSHISLIPAAHPLRPIALDCIKDRDAERPTAAQLCETLSNSLNQPLCMLLVCNKFVTGSFNLGHKDKQLKQRNSSYNTSE